MKKSFFILLLILSFSVSLFATNGDNMIGVSIISRSMGGLGIGMPIGRTDNVFKNPAWMSNSTGTNFSFGGIIFMPTVHGMYSDGAGMNTNGYVKSDADMFAIPEVSIVSEINDLWSFGVGAFGVSGMGVDYRNKANGMLANMHTNLQFMRLTPGLSYKATPNFFIGGSLQLAYGLLDMGANMAMDTDNDLTNGFEKQWNAGGGSSQTFGFGYELGLAYILNDNIYFGLNYKSKVKMTYDKVFDTNGDGSYENLKLDQPAEFGFGSGIQVNDKFKIGLDISWIDWEGSNGYNEFKWENQMVYALGSEYKLTDKLALRLGYNYGKTPIDSKNVTGSMNMNTINDFSSPFGDFDVEWFNLIGFPAITEQHLTFGLGYQLSKNLCFNFAYVYAIEKTIETSGTKFYGTGSNDAVAATTGAKNKQNSFAFALDWHF